MQTGELTCRRVCSDGRVGSDCDACLKGWYFVDELSGCRRCDAWATCPGGKFSAATQAPCPAGREPDAETGQRCDACPSGRATPGFAVCQVCGPSQEPVLEGKACACTFGHYNSSAVSAGRSIQCLAHDWRMDSLLTDAQCEPCSDVECAVCGNGLKVLAGWQAFGTPANVFRCPFEDGCLDDGRGCSVGYTGTLCGVCDTGYDQLHRSCKLCTETGTQTALVFFGLIGIGSVAWVGWWLHSKSTTAVGRGLRTQLTVDNPVHGGEYILEAKSDTGTQQTHPSSLFRMLYHPGRIMIGFFQVVTQIGPVTFTPCVRLLCSSSCKC